MTVTMAVAGALSGSGAHAAGVTPGGSMTVEFDSDLGGPFTISGTQVGGGTCDYSDETGCDVIVDNGSGFLFGFYWSGPESFRVALFDENFSSGPSSVDVTADVTLPADHAITNIAPAPSTTFSGFLFDPVDNPTSPITDPSFPTIGFSNGTGSARIELMFSGIDPDWWPDGGYYLDFDVAFETLGGPTSPVPLPAAGWLLLGCLGALAAWRQRNQS